MTAHFGHDVTQDDVRAHVWRQLRTVREAKGAPAAFGVDQARQIVARDAGFGSWDQLTHALQTGGEAPPAFSIDRATRTLALTRHLTRHDWDTVLAVMKEHQVEALDAHGYMTDEAIARIASAPSLTRLVLGGSRQLTDEGLQHLRRMPQLQHLDLSEYPGGVITDRGLEPLADLPDLRTFVMTWQRGITDAGVAHLARCERLERVNLMGTATGDGAIAALAGKRHLTHLDTGRQVTDAGLLRLVEFPQFTTPHDRPFAASLLGFEDGGTRLLIDGPITDRGLAALAPLEGLDELSLFWHTAALTPSGLRVLRQLTGLRALVCRGELCTDVAMEHIAAMPRLRKLMAQGTVATDMGFIALSRSPTLEHLWGRECPNLTGRGFVALSQLPALRGLAVSCKQVDDVALARLPHFPALRELLPMDVSDAGFRHVGACVDLDYLCCMYCRDTTDEATRQLRGLNRIRRYYAGATQITDASLELLSTLRTLERVEIYECLNVTDVGVRHLATLPRLRELSLSGLPLVTRSTVNALPASIRVEYSA